ncbi:MAG: chloride channel protein [Dehalococcoidia bacterium]
MQQENHSKLLRLLSYPWNLLLRTSDNAVGILLAAIIGVGSGFGAVAFWKLIEFFSWVFFKKGSDWFDFFGDYYVIILPAIGGLIFGPIIYYFAREARGEGPPEIMEAMAVRGGRVRMRVAAAKVLVSSICIGSGGSVGREGPIVQIGGSLGSTIGQVFRVPERWLQTLVLCGVAGGIAATFNAPIAGAFFALEVVQRRIVALNVGFVILSSVMASIISRIFLFKEDNLTSFQLPEKYGMESNQEILLYLLLGIICAAAGILFVRFFYRTEDFFNRWNLPVLLTPIIGGLLVGGLGFISLELVSSDTFLADIFGVGYGNHYTAGGEFLETGTLDSILTGEGALYIIISLIALKILATSITLGSGGSGGVFAPILFIGAALGSVFGNLFGDLFPDMTAPVGAYAMVGMAGFFAVVVRGPITAILIIFELTGDYDIILPVMTTVVVGIIIARVFSRESIYTWRLKRRGVDPSIMEEHDVMRTMTVSQVMTRNFPSVPAGMPVVEALRQMEQMGHLGFPVVDEEGRLQGIVTLTDIHAGTQKEGADIHKLVVKDIATPAKSLVVAYPDQTLHHALLRVGAKDFGRIPVVDRKDPSRIVGCLRRHDIVQAYISGISPPPPEPKPPEGSIVF